MNDNHLESPVGATDRTVDDHGDPVTVYVYEPTPEERAASMARQRLASFSFQHDDRNGTFRLEWPDGAVEAFRDKPVRYLVVEPDETTGGMKPVLKRGCPTYLYLCREDPQGR